MVLCGEFFLIFINPFGRLTLVADLIMPQLVSEMSDYLNKYFEFFT